MIEDISNLKIAILISVVLLIIILILWYMSESIGWKSFKLVRDENFFVTVPKKTLKTIKWKKCIFSVYNKNDKNNVKSKDVSKNLKMMTDGFVDVGEEEKELNFRLAEGLSPYSFHIDGFNDKDTVIDNKLSEEWDDTSDKNQVKLIGEYKII